MLEVSKGRGEKRRPWIARVHHFDWIFFRCTAKFIRPVGLDRELRSRARSLASPRFVRLLFQARSTSPLLRRCVNRITVSIQRAIAWGTGGDSQAAVSTECNSPKTMHRVKMARIDNPMPLWSIPYMHNTHTRVERIDTRARLALFFADRARRGMQRLAIRAAETGPAGEGKSEGRRKTSRSFHLLRPYISPILARPSFPSRI